MIDCILWAGAINNKGYGVRTVDYKHWLAHRYSFHITHPKIDISKKLILHKCDVRNCVNPKHLFVGSAKDNTLDMIKKGRWKKPKYNYGSKHHNSKLTEEQIKYLKKVYSRRVRGTIKQLTIQFGIDRHSVSRIAKNNK